MNLTPLQAREILQIGEETLRYWKRTIPPISNRKGYSPCYSFADLVAMEVVGVLTRRFGVAIGTITPMAERLFSVLDKAPFLRIGDEFLVISEDFRNVQVTDKLDAKVIQSPSIVLPMRPLVDDLRDRVFDALGGTPPQLSLGLPPVALRSSSGT